MDEVILYILICFDIFILKIDNFFKNIGSC